MAASRFRLSERPRELRRRVVLPARMRAGAQWSDVCILNISSRGLLIQSGLAGSQGSLVEVRRGDHVMVARIVWRDGSRAGLQCEDRVPVEEIMSLGAAQALRLVASEGALVERRKYRRANHGESRLQGRAMEFVAVLAIGIALAIGTWSAVEEALAKPFAQISTVLGG